MNQQTKILINFIYILETCSELMGRNWDGQWNGMLLRLELLQSIIQIQIYKRMGLKRGGAGG